MVAAVLVAVLLHPLAAQAEWYAAWSADVSTGFLTPELVASYLDFRDRHVSQLERRPPAPGISSSSGDTAEAWRSLVAATFHPSDVEWALAVIRCESGGDPNAYNRSSGASGLFQHLAKYWSARAEAAGWAGADIFDPEANVAVSAWLYYHGGPGHWTCP